MKNISNVVLKNSIKINTLGKFFGESLLEKGEEKIIGMLQRFLGFACDGGCTICMMVCGISIIWFIVDQKGETPKKYFYGSFVVYLGLRVIQYIYA